MPAVYVHKIEVTSVHVVEVTASSGLAATRIALERLADHTVAQAQRVSAETVERR